MHSPQPSSTPRPRLALVPCHAPLPSAPAERPCRASACAPRALARPARLCRAPSLHAVSLVQWLYCNTTLPMSLAPRSQYTRVYCDTNCPQPSLLQYNPAIHFPTTSLSQSQYTRCIAIQSQPTSCPFQPAIQ